MGGWGFGLGREARIVTEVTNLVDEPRSRCFRPYPSYKGSGMDWLATTPSHWQVGRLKDYGVLIGGAGFPHDYQGTDDEVLPFYKVGDLSISSDGRHMGRALHSVSSEVATELGAHVIPEDSIIYAKIGAALFLNRRRVTTMPCCIDNNMTAYVPHKRELTPDWAFYWTTIVDFGALANPGAVPSLSEGDQTNIPILVPPMQEQRAIAYFLDHETAEIDALVARKERLIELLLEKRTALITRAVTKGLDPNVSMKDSGVEWLGEIPAHWNVNRLRVTVTGCQNGAWGTEADGMHDMVCVRVADFDRLQFRARLDNPTVRSIEPKIAQTRRLEQGDLLLEKSGGGEKQPVGAVVIYDHEESAVCSNFVARMQVATGHSPRYLTYLHATLYSARINVRSIKQSTGIQNLDGESYLNEFVGLPKGPEQRAIAGFLDDATTSIDVLAARVRQAIGRLGELRSALISAAVTGKIDVREAVPR